MAARPIFIGTSPDADYQYRSSIARSGLVELVDDGDEIADAAGCDDHRSLPVEPADGVVIVGQKADRAAIGFDFPAARLGVGSNFTIRVTIGTNSWPASSSSSVRRTSPARLSSSFTRATREPGRRRWRSTGRDTRSENSEPARRRRAAVPGCQSAPAALRIVLQCEARRWNGKLV